MGPNQGMANQPSMQPTPTQPTQPIEQPAQGGNDIVFQDKPKKNTGMILGMLLLLLLAAGGIGFGVWAMMDGNSQKDALNQQITALKKQNDDLTEQVSQLNEQLTALQTDEEDGISAEVVDGVLYIMDGSDEVLAQSDEIEGLEIVSCGFISEDNETDIESETDTNTEASSSLKCVVSTSDGEGWFTYNTTEGQLKSSFSE